MSSDTLGLWATLAFTFLLCALVGRSRISNPLKALLITALVLRVVGAVAYNIVTQEVYGGKADVVTYYRYGLQYAQQFIHLDFSPFTNSELWRGQKWWGTQFISFPTGIVLALVGPTMLGASIVFSLASFIGLIGFAVAFSRSYPSVRLGRYARWIWLFPALWFWPATIGKEAVIIMGLGLATMGFIGKNEHIRWPPLVLGLFFVFAIRPQVAAVVILSLILAQSLSLGNRWTLGRALQGVAVVGTGLFGIWLSLQYIGVDGFDVEGVQSYMESNTARAQGNSRIEAVGVGWSKVPVAMANILLRPFPWEARNLMMLLSAIEVLALWGAVLYRRDNVANALRYWKSDRFLRMAVCFIVVYAVTLGMLTANLGIIARQRIVLFPFVFLLMEAVPGMAERRRSRPSRLPVTPLSAAMTAAPVIR